MECYGRPLLVNVTPDITLGNLTTIMLNHITYYAFSNLYYLNKSEVDVSYFPTSVIDKINRDKYGICMDLNYAFSQFLTSRGYDNYLIKTFRSGSQMESRGIFHPSIIVILNDKKYFIDVGYGQTFTRPVLLDDVVENLDLNSNVKYMYFKKERLRLIDVPLDIKDITENYNKIAGANSRDMALRNRLFHRIYNADYGDYVGISRAKL